MYAGKNTPVELPKTGHLHILTNGYVYWENDGKWDKEARRMRDSRVSIGKMADAEKGLFYPNRKYWDRVKSCSDPVHKKGLYSANT